MEAMSAKQSTEFHDHRIIQVVDIALIITLASNEFRENTDF